MDLKEFEDWMYERYAQKTIEDTIRTIKRLMKYNVNIENKQSFIEWIRNERRKGRLDRTLNSYIKAYNRVLEFLGLENEKIKRFKVKESYKTVKATEDDFKKLIEACKFDSYTALRNEAMIRLIFTTGIRYKELITLRLSNLNGDILTIIGKGQKVRQVYVPPSTLKALHKYLQFRVANPGNDYIFLNRYGEPLTYAGGRQILYEIAKKAGVHFSAHMGRRFYATYLYRNGVGIEEIRQLLGHSKISTTQEYLKITQDDVINDLRSRKIDFFRGTLPALPVCNGMLPAGFEPASRD